MKRTKSAKTFNLGPQAWNERKRYLAHVYLHIATDRWVQQCNFNLLIFLCICPAAVYKSSFVWHKTSILSNGIWKMFCYGNSQLYFYQNVKISKPHICLLFRNYVLWQSEHFCSLWCLTMGFKFYLTAVIFSFSLPVPFIAPKKWSIHETFVEQNPY